MSGNFKNRHHVEPIVIVYSPRKEPFPIPLKYIDVSRTFHTNLAVKQKKCIDVHWNVDGSKDLSNPRKGYHSIYVIGRKTFQTDVCGPVGCMVKKSKLRVLVSGRKINFGPGV